VRFEVVSLFPEMFAAVRCCGITRRALEQGLIRLGCWDPRDYATDSYRTVDDRPYGGGPGMVMRVHPLYEAVTAARGAAPGAAVVYLSPQGRRLDQEGVRQLASRPGLVLVAGRYEGVDERVIQETVDEEWSIGDYVLSGGELAAMVVIDAVTRQLPGALGHGDSAREDSFFAGLLDCPHYTRPEEALGRRVPGVLLEGNHAAIRRWRLKQALARTWQRRPDLLEGLELDEEQRALLAEFQREAAQGAADPQ
jgi:tRNA (guanine37-N1)-methyltransferase